MKRSCDRDQAHFMDYLSIPRLILYMANHYTNFEVSSFSRSTDILEKLKV